MQSGENRPNPKAFGVFLGLLIIAFVTLGFTFPDSGASYYALPFEALATAQTQPAGEDGSDQNIDPTIAYQELMNDLNQYYYWKDKIDVEDLTAAAIRGMLAALDDPYTRYLDKAEWAEMNEENRGDFSGIGATIGLPEPGRPTIDWVIEGNPADRAGLKSGDVIVGVKDDNGSIKVTKNMLLSDVVKKIKGISGTVVTLTVERAVDDGTAKAPVTETDEKDAAKAPKPEMKTLDIPITRGRVEIPVVRVRKPDEWEKYGLENPEKYGIGYLRLTQFNQKTDQLMMEEIERIRTRLGDNFNGLILDLRANPGGLLTSAVAVSQRFAGGPLYNNVIVSVKDSGHTQEAVHRASASSTIKHVLGLDLKIVVLTDRNTASGAEILAGAIKDYGIGTLIGERTFGKGLVQTLFQLPPDNQTAVAITTAIYYTPSHYSIAEEGGIAPDIEVKYDEKQPMKDLQAKKAIEVLRDMLTVKAAKHK